MQDASVSVHDSEARQPVGEVVPQNLESATDPVRGTKVGNDGGRQDDQGATAVEVRPVGRRRRRRVSVSLELTIDGTRFFSPMS